MLGVFPKVVDLLPESVSHWDGTLGQKQKMGISHFIEQRKLF